MQVFLPFLFNRLPSVENPAPAPFSGVEVRLLLLLPTSACLSEIVSSLPLLLTCRINVFWVSLPLNSIMSWTPVDWADRGIRANEYTYNSSGEMREHFKMSFRSQIQLKRWLNTWKVKVTWECSWDFLQILPYIQSSFLLKTFFPWGLMILII